VDRARSLQQFLCPRYLLGGIAVNGQQCATTYSAQVVTQESTVDHSTVDSGSRLMALNALV
jgi:hypothetical protein